MWKNFWKSSIGLGDIAKIVTKNGGKFKNQSLIILQPIEFLKKFFHICFYHVTFFQNYLFVLPYLEILILLSILWRRFPAKNS